MKAAALLLGCILVAASAKAAPALCPPVGGDPGTTDTLRQLLGLTGTEPIAVVRRMLYPDCRVEETVTLPDGLILHVTFARPQAPEADTIILLHEMGSSRHDWDLLMRPLVQAGFGVIAPDLRGCAESMQKEDGSMVSAATFDHLAVPNPWLRLVGDVTPLVDWAKAQHHVQGGRFSVMGSVLGASVAGLALAEKPLELNAAVLLSPQPMYYNLDLYKALRDLQGHPILIMVGSREDYVKERLNRLKGSGKSTSTYTVKTESGEGVRLLTPDAVERVIGFFEDQRQTALASIERAKAEATPRPTPLPTKVVPKVTSQIVGHRKLKATPTPTPTPTSARRPGPI